MRKLLWRWGWAVDEWAHHQGPVVEWLFRPLCNLMDYWACR